MSSAMLDLITEERADTLTETIVALCTSRGSSKPEWLAS
jgi:hypothetical protein